MDPGFLKATSLSKAYGRSPLVEGLRMVASMAGIRLRAGGTRAVDDVSLEIRHGERVGIIGENGAGKSTLLHLLAGMLAPTSGRVEARGEVSCIMSIGTGIREELTGRENVALEAKVHGKSPEQIERYVREVTEFAELGEFIDQPVRTYSTGMKSRLAFATVTAVDPQILIIDEALSAGDAVFARKAAARMRDLTRRGAITLLVSHSMESIRELCDRCIWMSKGRIVFDGDPAAATNAYQKSARDRDDTWMKHEFESRLSRQSGIEGVHWDSLALSAGGDPAPRFTFAPGEWLSLAATLHTLAPVDAQDLRVRLTRADGILVMDRAASLDDFRVGRVEAGRSEIRIGIGEIALGQGVYQVEVAIVDGSGASSSIGAHFLIRSDMSVIGNPLQLRQATWRLAASPGAG